MSKHSSLPEKPKKKRPFSTAASLFVGGIWKIPNISRKKLLERKRAAQKEAQEEINPLHKTKKIPIK